MNDLPAPFTSQDCDLRDFKFIPIDIVRLFNSEFHARSDDAAWRAGMTIWMKSFHQVPAGSIPDDDVALARLAELGRDVRSWKKIREAALYRWVKCSDGRFYHPVVVEKVLEAWQGKKNQRVRTSKARLQAMLARLSKAADMIEIIHLESNLKTLLDELSRSMPQAEHILLERSVTESVAASKGKGERQEEGKRHGQGKYRETDAAMPVGADAPGRTENDPERMTRDEIWKSGRSLLMQAGMPREQCGSFLGKLVRDYGAGVVVEAVRAAVVERAADPATFLVGACKHRSGRHAGGSMEHRQQESTEQARRILFGGEDAIDG